MSDLRTTEAAARAPAAAVPAASAARAGAAAAIVCRASGGRLARWVEMCELVGRFMTARPATLGDLRASLEGDPRAEAVPLVVLIDTVGTANGFGADGFLALLAELTTARATRSARSWRTWRRGAGRTFVLLAVVVVMAIAFAIAH